MSYFSQGDQLTLFELPPVNGVVNVASIPQRSPFRYPGGKTWLIPRIRQWLKSLPRKPATLVEPFAGGAIVGLTAAFEQLAEKILLVEIDNQVGAVWKTVLSEDNEWLARRIISFDLTGDNVRAVLESTNSSTREKAFRTILKNRTFHGGILAPGSSLIRSGENGKGIRSRWYPQTLARRIRTIGKVRERIGFIEGDGIAVIRQYGNRQRAAFFIDPPYTMAGKKAGSRLYTHHVLDHEQLFACTSRVAGDFLMTYDSAEEVAALAKKHGLQIREVAMKNTHHECMTEFLIGRNLHWVR